VWYLISTGVHHCVSCDLVRTIGAHILHLDEMGACGDAGQELRIVTAADEDLSLDLVCSTTTAQLDGIVVCGPGS
jgi:hypothetical protein